MMVVVVMVVMMMMTMTMVVAYGGVAVIARTFPAHTTHHSPNTYSPTLRDTRTPFVS